MRLGIRHALVAVLAAAFVLPAAAFGAELLGLGNTEDRRDRGQQLGAEYAVSRRLPDLVTRRAQPLHGVEPSSICRRHEDGPDIWVARRESTESAFGAPENLGAPINSTADDFCPTPVRGSGLFFVSRRATAERCGLGDIYFARRSQVGDGASRVISPAHRRARTAVSTNRVPRTSRRATSLPLLLQELGQRPRGHLRQR